MTADDPRPAGEACATCKHPRSLHVWEQDQLCSGSTGSRYGCGCSRFRPAASGGATDGEREDAADLAGVCRTCGTQHPCPVHYRSEPNPEPVASQAVQRLLADAAAAQRVRATSPVRQAASVLSDRELSDALDLWYRLRREPEQADDPLRDALGGEPRC